MQIIGFNFVKISAERYPNFKQGSINTNIEFKEIETEKVNLLKEGEAIKVTFISDVTYSNKDSKKEDPTAKISFEGFIVLSTTSDESKDILKAWKKKDLSPQFKSSLFNVILKKCSLKAMALEEDLGLPLHIPFPQIRAEPEKK